MKTIITLLVLVVVIGLGFLVFLYSGVYNIAATDHHNRLTLWVIHTLVDHSIEKRAKQIEIPSDLSNPAMVAQGFKQYDEMCVDCHGGVGVKGEKFSEGLYPHPPDLQRSVPTLSRAELFWIVKNGIKMSGMPAFDSSLTDGQAWDVVAFLEKMPTMTPTEYQNMKATYGGEETDDE